MTMEVMIMTVCMTVIGEVIAAMIIHEIFKKDDDDDDDDHLPVAPASAIAVQEFFL